MGLFEKAYTDKEWLEEIKPDEDYLFDRSVVPFVTAGYEEVYIENGKIIEVCAGEREDGKEMSSKS
jgi:hypothetical protein